MFGGVFGDGPLRGFVEQLHLFLVDGDHNTFAAALRVELAGDGEHGVADFFSREPACAHVPEQAILGIEARRRRDAGRL